MKVDSAHVIHQLHEMIRGNLLPHCEKILDSAFGADATASAFGEDHFGRGW